MTAAETNPVFGGPGTAHVKMAELRETCRGRETEILDKLGVPYRSGNPHISCPYPDHRDHDPSWRWDEGRALAYCTCIGTRPGERKAHQIVNVVACIEGLSFEPAKIRVAKLIGREDIIRVRGKNKYYQRHDAESLLFPPPDNRDDELPFVYLGSRLGIEPADVPRPATAVVGIKSLEYFDPPSSQRAKPKLVGSRPCAVFGTVAADGRRHAHRIYLSPDGRAKADLGIGRDGKTRDPKKSAKLADRQPSIAGCAGVTRRKPRI